MSWELPTSVDIQGTVYEIRSDYRAVLDICAALSDPELSDEDKAEAALIIFYPDFKIIPYAHHREALERCYWFIDCGRDDWNASKPTKLVDWEQDFPYIAASVNRVLGREIRSPEYLHWWTFIGAYMEIGDCLFAQIVGIRDKQARGKTLNKQEQAWYQHNRQLVDFKSKYTGADKNTLQQWGC